MKVNSHIFVISLVIYSINTILSNSYLLKNNNNYSLFRKSKKVKASSRASEIDEGLKAFGKAIFSDVSKHSYLPPNSCDPKTDKECRGIFESIAIAYDRALKFGNFISISECRGDTGLNDKTCLEKSNARDKLKSLYLVENNIKLKKEETNRFVFSVSMTNDGSSEKSDKLGSNYLVKVCVPNNKNEKYYIDFNCPHDECDPTYSEIYQPKECANNAKN